MTGLFSHREGGSHRPTVVGCIGILGRLGSVLSLRCTAVRLIAASMLSMGLALSLHGQEPPGSLDAGAKRLVDELIDELNSNGFQRREAAAERLVEMGRVVLPHLNRRQRRGLEPEQANRLRGVITALERGGLERRIESFLDGQSTDLDNWGLFEEWFGDTPRSRELFVELVRDYPELVLSLDGDAAQIDSGLQATVARISRNRVGVMGEVRRSDLIALLLPTASKDYRTDVLVELYLLSWFHRSVGRELRNDREWSEPFLRLVSKWIEKTSLGNRSRALHRALDWRLDVAYELAVKTLPQNPDPELTARCLQCIARQGSAKDQADAAKFLGDERRLVTVRSMSGTLLTIEVGDVAAATIAYLNNVKVTEVGFAEPIEHPTFGIIYEQIRFPSTEERSDPGDFETLRKQRDAIRATVRKRFNIAPLEPKTEPEDSTEPKAGSNAPGVDSTEDETAKP